jgi:hypothetical protein
MDSEPTSTQAPALVATEMVPDPTPVTTPASNPHAAGNKEQISTNDVPHAEQAQNKQEGSNDESVWPSRWKLNFFCLD